MSELERLHQAIDGLPSEQVHALLTLLEASQPITDEQFACCLSRSPEEEVDQPARARLLAAEAEQGESISHADLKRRLGL